MRSKTTWSVLLLAALVIGAAGCGNQTGKKKKKKPKTFDFKTEVEVTEADGGAPITGVPIKIDGKTVGYTDKEGIFKGVINDRPGRKIELSAGAVEGFRYLEGQSTTVKLDVKKGLSGNKRRGVPILMHAVAESILENYLVWVSLTCDEDSMDQEDCQGLPVLRDGKQIATTDKNGTAHFSLTEQPGTTLEVKVDTRKDEEDDDLPIYEPADPVWKIKLSLDPKVYLVETTFEDPEGDEPRWRPPPPSTTTSSSDDSEDDSGGGGGGGGTTSGGGGGGGGSDDDGGGSGDNSGPIDLF